MAREGASPSGRSKDPRRVIIPLTTSLSGIPIASSYQGGGLYDFSAMKKARWSEFYGTQHQQRNLGYDYNFKNRFVSSDSLEAEAVYKQPVVNPVVPKLYKNQPTLLNRIRLLLKLRVLE